MELDLLPVSLANGGFFLRRQALDVGLTDRDLGEWLRRGTLVRVRQGAYAFAADLTGLSDSERHVVLTRAVVAAQRGSVAAIGHSAAALHGLPLYGCDLSVVHVVRLDGGAARNEAGVSHHAFTRDLRPDLVEMSGLPATSLARTVWDVARASGVDAGVVAADAALRRDLTVGDEMRELVRRLTNQPGSRAASQVVWLADGRAESPGESRLRVRFVRYGIPKPELQVEVFDEDGVLVGRTDFGWEAYRHLGEFDGAIKYGRLLRPGETATDVIVREKQREDSLRRLRNGMSRFTWSTMLPRQVDREMAQLMRDLDQSRRLYVVL